MKGLGYLYSLYVVAMAALVVALGWSWLGASSRPARQCICPIVPCQCEPAECKCPGCYHVQPSRN